MQVSRQSHSVLELVRGVQEVAFGSSCEQRSPLVQDAHLV